MPHSAKPDIALYLTSYEAALVHLLAALGIHAYEGHEMSEMVRELVDRIPPEHLMRIMEKLGDWAEAEVH